MPRNGHGNGHNKIALPSLEQMMEGVEFEPSIQESYIHRPDSIGAIAIVRGYRLSLAGNKRASKQESSQEELSEELSDESTNL